MTQRRRAASFYAVAFLLAAAAAPHRHTNELADLLSDERSDSGFFVEALSPPDEDGGPYVTGARVVIDSPCLACFQHDFVAAIAPLFSMAAPSPSFTLTQNSHRRFQPKAYPQLRASRSPPSHV